MGKNKEGYRINAGEVELFPYIDENSDKKNADRFSIVWIVRIRKDDKEEIGKIFFEDIDEPEAKKLCFEFDKKYIEHRYAKDAVNEMAQWALMQKGVKNVYASAHHEDDFSIFMLEKAGFVYRYMDGDTEYYSIERDKPVWLGLYLIIGFCAGLVIGIVIGNLPAGLAGGLLIGVAIGAGLDKKEQEKNI